MNGVRELVGANEPGIIAGRNPEEVARALVKLATDPELRLKMGRIGARRAAAFSQDAVAARILSLHDSLLERAPKS